MRMASKSVVSDPRLSNDGRIYLALRQNGFAFDRGGLGLDQLLLRLHQLDVQAQRLELADEDVERLRQTGLERRVALDDRLVDLRAARDVVRLRGEELLEDVRRAVGLERPHFHFSEPLSTELRLAAQRLLGDERVGSDR